MERGWGDPQLQNSKKGRSQLSNVTERTYLIVARSGCEHEARQNICSVDNCSAQTLQLDFATSLVRALDSPR